MIQDILADVAPFAEISDRSARSGGLSEDDKRRSLALAPLIVRKHRDFFTAFFMTCLSELEPSLRAEADGHVEYSFRNADDAGQSAEMVFTQNVNEGLSAAACSMVLLAFLQRSTKSSGITREEADASIRTVARLSYEYRAQAMEGLLSHVSNAGQRQSAQRGLRSLLVVVTIVAVAAWWVLR